MARGQQRWRRNRLRRVAAHAERVQEHLRRFGRAATSPVAKSRATMGRPRAVWCVELHRVFRTLSEAAAFVDRKPSNISQSLKRGVRCGPYHWQPFDPARHLAQGIVESSVGATVSAT